VKAGNSGTAAFGDLRAYPEGRIKVSKFDSTAPIAAGLGTGRTWYTQVAETTQTCRADNWLLNGGRSLIERKGVGSVQVCGPANHVR